MEEGKVMKNTFKEKIKKAEKPLGTFIDTCSPYVIECVGRTGMDYVIIDNEHSPVEAETTAQLVRAAELSGVTPLARVREISRPAVLKLLDVGIQGIIIPNVSSVDEVQKLVLYAKYKPIGDRGFCPSRKDGWGYDLNMSVPETMNYFNDQVLVIPQCETAEALENIEEIVSIDGVDGIFIGPFDLSISMGIPGEFTNPVFIAAKKRILDACRSAGKFCMLFAGNMDGVLDGYAFGFDSMTYSLDAGLIIQCISEKVKEIKEKI